MTEGNKPIIIDGVDVSKCKFYNKNKKYCLNLKMNPVGFKNPSCFSGDFQECIQDSKTCPYTFCDNNHNYYFKRLTRKTQECEELKDKIKFMEGYIKTVENARDELERENKFSKEQAEQKLEQLKLGLKKIFRCLIKENRGGAIKDTIWLNSYTTLWDYIDKILDIQGDQNEIENKS